MDLSRYDNIHVFGGGLLGSYIASGLSKKIHPADQKLSLYDQSNTLFSSWDSKVINSVYCNNGFHGIESPRADLISDFLQQSGCRKYTVQVPNHRILCIENNEIAFTESICDWPKSLAFGLDEILAKNDCVDLYDPDVVKMILYDTQIGSIIRQVYTRFSDQIMECWHLICPWFFPREFLFPGNDEGSIFQNNVRKKLIQPLYTVPKSNIFSDFRPIISNSLKNLSVNLCLESKITRESIVQCCAQAGNLAVWCASSFSLLASINPQLAQECISSSRHMNLILFSVDERSYDLWVNSFSMLPTEILYLNSSVPELNRISFPQQVRLNAGDRPCRIYILAECFTKEKSPDSELLFSIQDFLSKQFSSVIKLEGSSYGRPLFNLSSSYYPNAEQLVHDFSRNINLLVPSIYFGPINMAKCGIVGHDFLKML